jgi:hypothetical protein
MHPPLYSLQGVLACKKDMNLPKHQYIEVPNVHACKAAQSLKSRGFVKEQFNWYARAHTHTHTHFLDFCLALLSIFLTYSCAQLYSSTLTLTDSFSQSLTHYTLHTTHHTSPHLTTPHHRGWYYYTLTDEGIEYLRQYLHVSADTKPKTLISKDDGKCVCVCVCVRESM